MGVCVLGSINLDTVHRVARLPRAGETVMSLETARFLGGKGANQAVASTRAGASTRLLGAVGADPGGQDIVVRLDLEGIDVSRVATKADAETGSAHICVSAEGENQIVVSSGANGALTIDDVAAEDLAGCAVLLAQLETPVEVLSALLPVAAEAGIVRILNAAPALPEARALFGQIDILVVNETELAAYAAPDLIPSTAEACIKAARRLILSGPPTVIVTRGKAGALVVTRVEVLGAPGVKAEVVDATGAGDCFCGVLAASLAQGAPLPQSVGRANLAASLSVRRAGASDSMPNAAELDAAMLANIQAG